MTSQFKGPFLNVSDASRNSQSLDNERLWLLSAAVRQTTEGIAVADLDGNLVLVNQAFAASHGYSPDELIGRHLSMFHTPEQLPEVEAANQYLRETGKFRGEIWHARRDGSVFPALMCNSLLHDESGAPIGMIGTVADISERTRAEHTLRLNESRLDALLQLSRMADAPVQQITDFALEEAVRLTSSEIGYVGFLDEAETMFTVHSWSSSVMTQCQMKQKHVDFPIKTTGLLVDAVRQRKPIITNDYAAASPLKHGYPAGHVSIRRHLSVPVFDGPRIVAMAGVGNKEQLYDHADVRQLTLLIEGMWRLLQRKQSQQQLQEAHDELEVRIRQRTAELEEANAALRAEMDRRKELEREVLAISASEQRRLGQELHDVLGQELTGMGYLAESLYGQLRAGDAAEAVIAEQLAEGIQRALGRARSIARGLVPVEVHADGLARALQQLAATSERRYGIPCSCSCSCPTSWEDETAAHQLFRIAQEAVTNAARHARAGQISTALEHDQKHTILRVEDDGVGIPAEPERLAGVGLRIMEHRAALLGARLEIHASQNGGTVVTCTLPHRVAPTDTDPRLPND